VEWVTLDWEGVLATESEEMEQNELLLESLFSSATTFRGTLSLSVTLTAWPGTCSEESSAEGRRYNWQWLESRQENRQVSGVG